MSQVSLTCKNCNKDLGKLVNSLREIGGWNHGLPQVTFYWSTETTEKTATNKDHHQC